MTDLGQPSNLSDNELDSSDETNSDAEDSSRRRRRNKFCTERNNFEAKNNFTPNFRNDISNHNGGQSIPVIDSGKRRTRRVSEVISIDFLKKYGRNGHYADPRKASHRQPHQLDQQKQLHTHLPHTNQESKREDGHQRASSSIENHRDRSPVKSTSTPSNNTVINTSSSRQQRGFSRSNSAPRSIIIKSKRTQSVNSENSINATQGQTSTCYQNQVSATAASESVTNIPTPSNSQVELKKDHVIFINPKFVKKFVEKSLKLNQQTDSHDAQKVGENSPNFTHNINFETIPKDCLHTAATMTVIRLVTECIQDDHKRDEKQNKVLVSRLIETLDINRKKCTEQEVPFNELI